VVSQDHGGRLCEDKEAMDTPRIPSQGAIEVSFAHLDPIPMTQVANQITISSDHDLGSFLHSVKEGLVAKLGIKKKPILQLQQYSNKLPRNQHNSNKLLLDHNRNEHARQHYRQNEHHLNDPLQNLQNEPRLPNLNKKSENPPFLFEKMGSDRSING
jgi:hypothetical protein